MPRLLTLQEFLSGGNAIAIKKYKMTGILPSYVKSTTTKGAGKRKGKPMKGKVTSPARKLGIKKRNYYT
jgi:hypothetical protein